MTQLRFAKRSGVHYQANSTGGQQVVSSNAGESTFAIDRYELAACEVFNWKDHPTRQSNGNDLHPSKPEFFLWKDLFGGVALAAFFCVSVVSIIWVYAYVFTGYSGWSFVPEIVNVIP